AGHRRDERGGLRRAGFTNRSLRLIDDKIVAAAPMKGGLENRNAAETPGVGDDLVGEEAFEIAVGIEGDEEAGAKGVVVAGVLVGENDVLAGEAVFERVRRGVRLGGNGSRAVIFSGAGSIAMHGCPLG